MRIICHRPYFTQSYNEYGYWQQQGVDRGIILDTSKQILIDEKVRYRNEITGKVYDDIAVRYLLHVARDTATGGVG